jgi:hypothetical protein
VFEIHAVNGSIPSSPLITSLGSGFVLPRGIAVDAIGNVYVAEYYDNTVYQILAVNGSIPASPTIQTLGTGLVYANGVAVDGNRNVFVADYGDGRVVRLDYADPPSLNFASAAVGSTSTDSPQTVTVENVGNAALNFPIPSTGNDPSIAANFTLNDNGASACTVLSAGSSEPGTLAAGASCQLSISFAPAAAAALSGSLVLTDNNLNAAAPGYATQSIALSGTGTQATPTITWPTPAAITYGTALSGTQLNASSAVAGTFSYSPATGTVLTAGSQKLSVTFTPTNATNYTTATSSVTLTVNKATPTVKLTSSASSVTSGKSVTFTATLTGSGVKPTGTVTFLDGTTKLGTGTLNGSGVATFATSTLAVGRQSITASYGGDGNYLTATSTAIIVTVTAK